MIKTTTTKQTNNNDNKSHTLDDNVMAIRRESCVIVTREDNE